YLYKKIHNSDLDITHEKNLFEHICNISMHLSETEFFRMFGGNRLLQYYIRIKNPMALQLFEFMEYQNIKITNENINAYIVYCLSNEDTKMAIDVYNEYEKRNTCVIYTDTYNCLLALYQLENNTDAAMDIYNRMKKYYNL